MLLKHIPGPATLTVETVVGKVSRSLYGGNLLVEAATLPSTSKGNTCRFVLKAKNAHSKPARRAATGRATLAVDWQAHKEVIREIFDLYPNATLVTGLTTYTSKSDFERRAP